MSCVSTEASSLESILPPHRTMSPTRQSCKLRRMRQHGRQSRGACAFSNGFLHVRKKGNRAFDMLFFDQDDVINELRGRLFP